MQELKVEGSAYYRIISSQPPFPPAGNSSTSLSHVEASSVLNQMVWEFLRGGLFARSFDTPVMGQ